MYNSSKGKQHYATVNVSHISEIMINTENKLL